MPWFLITGGVGRMQYTAVFYYSVSMYISTIYIPRYRRPAAAPDRHQPRDLAAVPEAAVLPPAGGLPLRVQLQPPLRRHRHGACLRVYTIYYLHTIHFIYSLVL